MPVKLQFIAMACHEANRAVCLSNGDESQSPWGSAPGWQKDSCIEGVITILKDPDITAAELHQVWMNRKQREGWMYGPIKNPENKTHPCLMPYEQLPEEQKVKDRLFHAIVRALTAA